MSKNCNSFSTQIPSAITDMSFWVNFSKWPCKAKFKYVESDRFVEFIEIENTFESKFDPIVKFNLSLIEKSINEAGHIKIDFSIDETKCTDKEIKREYCQFLRFVLVILNLIKKDFESAKLEVPEIKIIFLNALNEIVIQANEQQVEQMLVSNEKAIF